ncbi:gp53-like domain-containing protein [Brucella ciceri]|uniref:gp53-like domain-containing protein n=1 Tax=Brucella ciceri TaxID=391287 RepID=UPI0035BBCB58
MAVLPDYVTGTITLANGSTTVNGTGTMFATAAFRPGDTLQIQNLTAIIASVDSNTSLTLTEPWTGTSLTNAPYRARYLPDGARVTAQTTTLIELLGNGVLSNIASVPVQDGKLLVGNAAGQYVPIDKSAVGVQDPNGSLGKLAALTLAANRILNTDGSGNLTQSDITAAALVLLKLAGTSAANKLPYFDAANSAALADYTAAARALTNLSGTAAADMLPYLTGASGAGLTALTAFARTLLDDPNALTMATTLGNVWSYASNGYCKLSFGVYLMWGATSSANSDFRIYFPTAFPIYCAYVNMINVYDYGGATNTYMAASTSNPDKTGFDARCRVIQNGGYVGAQTNLPIRWFAIGW